MAQESEESPIPVLHLPMAGVLGFEPDGSEDWSLGFLTSMALNPRSYSVGPFMTFP